MSNFERIKTCVQSATVSDDDKKSMLDAFADISDENLVDIAELFEKKSNWVVIFNDTRKKKQEAYAKGDESLWAEILEQEKKYLEDLTYGLD